MRTASRSLSLAITFALLVPLSSLAQQKPAATASEFYLQYRDAFEKAKSIEDLYPFVTTEMRTKMEETPADEREMMFEMMQMMGKMTDMKVVKESQAGDTYTLEVTGNDMEKSPMKGTITIKKEGGEWRLERESWSSGQQ